MCYSLMANQIVVICNAPTRHAVGLQNCKYQ